MKKLFPIISVLYYPKNELEGKSIKELNEMLQILIDRKILNKGGKI